MSTFKIITGDGLEIRFQLYWEEAPVTSRSFLDALPFETMFYHAKVSGEEIWTPDGLELHIPQENATVFLEEGEITLGPVHKRNRISKCIGIMYGQGQLLDCGNVFGKVFPEDLTLLKEAGNRLWTTGMQELRFEKLS